MGENDSDSFKRDWRFWMIFSGLTLSALLSALEGSIVSTALPTISAELDSGENYVWIINIYFLTCAIIQPLCGQFADLWGRRWLMIGSVLIFMAASAICGAAQNTAMLIVGRGIQGIGGGGINMLVDVIVCDLVPLRDRGNIIGLLFALISMVASFGPLFGGALTSAGQWRWIFYLNLPLGCIPLVVLFLFLRVSHRGGLTWRERLKRIDYVGNTILIASTVLILYVLTYAGLRYPWSNPHIIALLVVGFVLLLAFFLYERSAWCPYPVAPPVLFANRTPTIAFFITFTHAMLIYWATYFFPLYFQSVLGASPTKSGINLLVLVFVLPAATAICGAILAKTSEYKLLHLVGLAVTAVGLGCCSLLDQHSSTAMWAGLQTVVAVGIGIVMPALLPAVQAQLSDNESASSTGTWAFVRSLGTIWGVSIPAAVFNNRAEQVAGIVEDPTARGYLAGGHAYEHGTAAFLDQFDGETRDQIVTLYATALKLAWQVGVVFAGISVIAALFEKRVKLRKNLETDFGMEKKEKTKGPDDVEGDQPTEEAPNSLEASDRSGPLGNGRAGSPAEHPN